MMTMLRTIDQIIDRMKISEEAKESLRQYATFETYKRRVHRLIAECVVEERAHELVLQDYLEEKGLS